MYCLHAQGRGIVMQTTFPHSQAEGPRTLRGMSRVATHALPSFQVKGGCRKPFILAEMCHYVRAQGVKWRPDVGGWGAIARVTPRLVGCQPRAAHPIPNTDTGSSSA